MNPKNSNILCLIVLILAVFLLPLLTGPGILDWTEEDPIADDDDFSIISLVPEAWIRIPIHQMSGLFRLGISILTLFIVYLGGRSKHRRFNDRIIDTNNLLAAEFLRTALIRAVFHFQLIPHPLHTSHYLLSFTNSVLFPYGRSIRL
jgi:hypothetical protein